MALVTIAVINNHRAAPAARCLRTPSAPGASPARRCRPPSRSAGGDLGAEVQPTHRADGDVADHERTVISTRSIALECVFCQQATIACS